MKSERGEAAVNSAVGLEKVGFPYATRLPTLIRLACPAISSTVYPCVFIFLLYVYRTIASTFGFRTPLRCRSRFCLPKVGRIQFLTMPKETKQLCYKKCGQCRKDRQKVRAPVLLGRSRIYSHIENLSDFERSLKNASPSISAGCLRYKAATPDRLDNRLIQRRGRSCIQYPCWVLYLARTTILGPRTYNCKQ